MSILAVDMGGTVIKIGRVEHGSIQARESLPAHSERGAAQALSRTAEVLRQMRGTHCAGIGFAFPTLVDVRINRVMGEMIGKHEGVSNIDFAEWARAEFGLPIKVENDAHAAILGEWRYGAGRGCDDLVMMTLGTGIGTSVIIGGRPLRGKHAQAGNLGSHMILDPHGFPCVCGAQGCGEAQQTRTAINELARRDPDFNSSALSGLGEIDYAALFRLASSDPLAQRLLTRSLDIWGTMAASLVHQFDPEQIVMGGGIMRSADVILPHVQRWLDRACTPWGRVQAKAGELGDDAALFGMAVAVEEALSYL